MYRVVCLIQQDNVQSKESTDEDSELRQSL